MIDLNNLPTPDWAEPSLTSVEEGGIANAKDPAVHEIILDWYGVDLSPEIDAIAHVTRLDTYDPVDDVTLTGDVEGYVCMTRSPEERVFVSGPEEARALALACTALAEALERVTR
ncbi:MAG: hypothetical protein Q7T15_09325 [Microcella sp.]|uniref:hypothetical protein n=1 Tax=Microcella sp. TaxID=1913979 RepID=UPI00271F20D6|nr:hypothetical protein [Microcella sp.]MDO8338438.1 hypothetical protein [Microcella sp.]